MNNIKVYQNGILIAKIDCKLGSAHILSEIKDSLDKKASVNLQGENSGILIPFSELEKTTFVIDESTKLVGDDNLFNTPDFKCYNEAFKRIFGLDKDEKKFNKQYFTLKPNPCCGDLVSNAARVTIYSLNEDGSINNESKREFTNQDGILHEKLNVKKFTEQDMIYFARLSDDTCDKYSKLQEYIKNKCQA